MDIIFKESINKQVIARTNLSFVPRKGDFITNIGVDIAKCWEVLEVLITPDDGTTTILREFCVVFVRGVTERDNCLSQSLNIPMAKSNIVCDAHMKRFEFMQNYHEECEKIFQNQDITDEEKCNSLREETETQFEGFDFSEILLDCIKKYL